MKCFKKLKFNYGMLVLLVLCFAFILNFDNIKNFNWNSLTETTVTSNNGEAENKSIDYGMSVHFLDVGKADCCYIECEDKRILIDAADKEPTNAVVEYLERQKVKKLDLVVVSHPHRDHIGQMSSVINNFKIDKFIAAKVPDSITPTYATYEKMLRTLNKNNLKIEYVKSGKKFEIGNMKIEILAPINYHDKLNSNSIVMKITYGEVSFLFTGDAEKPEEEDIINSGENLKSTVLKVGHHGSKTSSSYNFLSKVKPAYAVISVAPDKSNLPKEIVLNRLNKFCDKIYRTDENGTVIMRTDGKKIKFETEK